MAGFGYTKAGQQFIQVIRTGVTMVVSGTSHNLALTKTGTVLAWGANDHGQAGMAGVKINTEIANHLGLLLIHYFFQGQQFPVGILQWVSFRIHNHGKKETCFWHVLCDFWTSTVTVSCHKWPQIS